MDGESVVSETSGLNAETANDDVSTMYIHLLLVYVTPSDVTPDDVTRVDVTPTDITPVHVTPAARVRGAVSLLSHLCGRRHRKLIRHLRHRLDTSHAHQRHQHPAAESRRRRPLLPHRLRAVHGLQVRHGQLEFRPPGL